MKKNVSIKLLALGAVSCLALSAVALNVNVNANADDTTTTTTTTAQAVETFEMANGAAVRVRDNQGGEFSDVTGIRFSMYFNTGYEGLTANGDTATLNTGYEASMTISTADGSESWDYTATELKLVSAADAGTTADVYAFRAVLAGFATENFGTKLTATGSLKQNGTEIGTELVAQTRSVAQVASKALLNPDEVVKDVKGDLKNYVDGVVTTDNFKFEKTALTTDKYKTDTVNEQIGATFPEDLWVDWTIEGDENVVVVDEETDEIAFGDNYGTATLTATLGSASYSTAITYGEPKVITVTADTAYMINYNANTTDTYRVYLSSDSEELSAIEGDYEGNAVKYINLNGYGNVFRANNPYTLEELNKIAVDYNKVTMWIAKNFVDESGETQQLDYWGGFLASAGFNPNDATNNEWYKISADIADFITLVEAETDNAFFEIWGGSQSYVNNTYSGVYIGDIGFEYVEPTIFTVTEDTAANIIRGTVTGTYVAAGADEIKNFSGDYTGAASKMVSAVGQNCFVTTSYTADEITAIATEYGYTHISMWMAVSATLNVGGASVYTKSVGSTWGAVKTTNTWVKYPVSIEDFVGQLSSGQVKLINFQTGSVNVYFGDIIFETIAE